MKHYYECLLHVPIGLLEDSYVYIQGSDSAHNEEHIRAVVKEADRLSEAEGYGFQSGDKIHTTIVTAALCHDLGCAVRGARDIHEVLSIQIFEGLIHGFDMEPLFSIKVKEAIRQHRASYKGERKSIASRILAAADRGRPNAAVLFMRAYVYTKEVNDVCHDVAIRHAIEYNRTKYGSKGYARMLDNELIREYYYKEAAQIEEEFDNATFQDVELILAIKFGLGE